MEILKGLLKKKKEHKKNTSRMDITVNTEKEWIFVLQKWKYIWKRSKDTKDWNDFEKKLFHDKADKLIGSMWSDVFKLSVKGTSEFAKRHKKTKFKLLIDIERVSNDSHWEVTVTKIPTGKFSSSSVSWGTRKITLDSEDTKARSIRKDGQKKIYKQFPIVHEFGHALGNSAYSYKGSHGDEYKKSSKYAKDVSSLMNIGSKIRKRHIDFLLKEINTIIPNTTFYIS